MNRVSLLSALVLILFGCKPRSDADQGSTVQDIADGTDWCHGRLRSTDSTEISIDYHVQNGVATPVWINVKRPGGTSNETVGAIVVPYKFARSSGPGSAQVTQSFDVSLPFSQNDGKFTSQVPNGLPLVDTPNNEQYFYEFAFKITKNGTDSYLKDPVSNKNNFRVDFLQINRENRYMCGDKPVRKKFQQVAAGSTNNPLDIDSLLIALDEVYDTFYGSSASAYSKNHNGGVPPKNEPDMCYGACPSNRWSALTCAYYCQFPSYSAVIPNIRGCFSYVVAGGVPMTDGSTRALKYDEAYDYCVFQDYDRVLNRIPKFDPNVIAANKAAGNRPGVMRWVDENQEDVFKYLMFTNGNPNAYNRNDEKEVLRQFNKRGHFARVPN